MGHEPKFKKSKERKMKKRYAFIAGLAISMIFGVVHAQSLDGNSMLGDTAPQEQAPQVPQQPPSMFTDLPITIKCAPVGYIRDLVESGLGQEILALGFNGLAAQQGSPFDGLVITRNEQTKEYTIIMMSSPNNAACIAAVGTQMRLKSEENTE